MRFLPVCWYLRRGWDLTELAMVEPLAIGAHGIRRAEVRPGEFVLVMGAGPIGLGLMEFAHIRGAEIIAMDTNTRRLDFCKSELGIKIYDRGLRK